MKKSMYTIKVILKWRLILAALYFVFDRLMLDRERVAMAAALAMLIIYVYWFPKKYTRYQTNQAEWEKKIHTSIITFIPDVKILAHRELLSILDIPEKNDYAS